MNQCFLQLVSLFAKFEALLNHRLRQKYFFSLAQICNNLKKYHLESNNFKKLIFVKTTSLTIQG
jgi:hypothetical protein